MTSRQHLALTGPPADLDGFPHRTADGTWYRAHRADRGGWWYASDGSGRFDLTPPDGTCYLDSDTDVAVRERLGETLVHAGMVSAVEADRMVVSRLLLDTVLADTTCQQATRYGITRELATITGYRLPQQWAAALHTAGWPGLCYWRRFSPGPACRAAAVFGPAGADNQTPGDPAPVSGRDACAQSGIAVYGIPHTLATIEPPSHSLDP